MHVVTQNNHHLQMKRKQDGVYSKGGNIGGVKVGLAVLSFRRYLRRHRATRSLKPDAVP